MAVGEARHGRSGSSHDLMVLTAERRARIRQRLEPILKEYDPELLFLSVFVDSTREYLAIVTQRGDQPALLKFRWVDFISTPDDALRQEVRSQLARKFESSAQTPEAGQPSLKS